MRHTESDLRDFLAEHARHRTGGEPSPQLDAIVRRGRRMRRTRRAATAVTATALAVTAAGLVNGLVAGPPRAQHAAVAQRPVDMAQVKTGPELPGEFHVVLGAEEYDLPLLHSERFATTGVGRTVTFAPTSFSTGYKVVCDDPRAWVVTVLPLKGGETGGTAGRCTGRGGGHHDELSAPSGWLKGPQSLQVWVFPADAPVREAAKALTDCRPAPESRSKGCDDESVQARALMRPRVRERLSALVGERPGRWAVGVYDRPAGGTP
ncbi:hypothetical protein MTP10_17090 [Nonomuraea sp. 3-1Str]|uniref:hypothetical protein n=1 Tax=Nonomuraea sp. 3-1Str TaxID=2929801 RepID=UPI00285940B7|nr:hypothetical protein [Nonomuraea sp. 3-1Str]MDR8410446.1 hypothetical protein [Nonomuraea sp. 3-1Str]